MTKRIAVEVVKFANSKQRGKTSHIEVNVERAKLTPKQVARLAKQIVAVVAEMQEEFDNS